MAELPILKATGLITNPNSASATPASAMTRADNVTSIRTGLLDPRETYSDYVGGANGAVQLTSEAIIVFGTNVDGTPRLVQHTVTPVGDAVTTIGGDEIGSGKVLVGDKPSPTGNQTSMVVGNGTLFYTSAVGVRRLPTTDPQYSDNWAAGMRRALAPYERLTAMVNSPTVAYNWFPTGMTTAYRIVIGRTDKDGKTVLSAPSPRCVLSNASGFARMPQLYVPLTYDLTVECFIQVYRTAMVPVGQDPGDDMGLVYERALTIPEITSDHYATIDDLAPDETRGAPLYTNSLQEGELAANVRPSQAIHLLAYNDRMLYMQTTGPQRITFTTLSNLNVGDTVTIGGTALTGVAAGGAWVMGSGFEVFTAGTVSENIDSTTRSLVANYNFSALNTASGSPEPQCLAYYLSGEEDAPGILLFEGYHPTSAQFTASVSVQSERFSPQFPLFSEAENKPGRVYWSKTGQHEAVPLLNYKDLGNVEAKILGAVASRDSMFVFKEDGIWRGSDDGRSIRFDRYDTSARLLAPKTAQPLGNLAYALTNQGVVEVNDTGISTVSLGIENIIKDLVEYQDNNGTANYFAVTHEASRTYRLFVVDTSVSGTRAGIIPNACYVYSLTTGEWTRHLVEASAACANPLSDHLFIAPVVDAIVNRWNGASQEDIVHHQASAKDLVSGRWWLELASTGGIRPGMYAVSPVSGVWEIDAVTHTDGFSLGRVRLVGSLASTSVTPGESWTFYAELEAAFEWAKTDAGDPMEVKHWKEMHVTFEEPLGDDVVPVMTLQADRSATSSERDCTLRDEAPHVLRVLVPREQRRATKMKVGLRTKGLTALQGIKIFLADYGNRSRK